MPADDAPAATASDPDPTPDPTADDLDAPRIYLTFDDGPSPTSTIQILDTLDAYGIQATFFVLGSQAEGYPDIVRLADSRGHAIANHSYSHDYDAIYQSAEAFMHDIERCEAALADILGHPPARLVRFPAGSAALQLERDPAMRDAIKQLLAAGGWRFYDWNASMGDSWAGGAPEPGYLGWAIVAQVDDMVAEGYTDIIVLAHDTDSRPWTPADLPMVIEHCQAQGYRFMTLSSDSPRCEYR
jgi:peptidoglycan/xylan/chitin deacetylase (PgdA/CDA1 family)